MDKDPPPRFLTTEQAAAVCHVARLTLHRWKAKGLIEPMETLANGTDLYDFHTTAELAAVRSLRLAALLRETKPGGTRLDGRREPMPGERPLFDDLDEELANTGTE